MKIQIMSDLHLDCQAEHVRKDFFINHVSPEADAIILAGDTVEGREIGLLKEMLQQVSKPLFYVLGNHDFWGLTHTEAYNFFRHQLSYFPNVKVLEKDYVVLGDTIIIGATLWTNLHNPINANMIRHYMADFRQCPGLTTDWTNKDHDAAVEFIRQCLKMEQWRDKKKIVVTHHGPSFEAVDECYKFDTANCGYQSNLNYYLYGEDHPDVWIHGHSHKFMDQMIGETRVIRNPFGYHSYGETDTGFKKNFLIDTDNLQELSVQKSVTDTWNEFEDQFK